MFTLGVSWAADNQRMSALFILSATLEEASLHGPDLQVYGVREPTAGAYEPCSPAKISSLTKIHILHEKSESCILSAPAIYTHWVSYNPIVLSWTYGLHSHVRWLHSQNGFFLCKPERRVVVAILVLWREAIYKTHQQCTIDNGPYLLDHYSK